MKRLAMTGLAMVALAGCGQAALAAGPTSADVSVVSTPTTVTSHPLLGVDVYGESAYTVTQATTHGKAVLGYLRTGLNAQVAGLMWDFCSPGFTSNIVRPCSGRTLSAADISALAKIAHAHHLRVQMRPIIRVGSPANWDIPKDSWEGRIKPTNPHRFFLNLLRAELPYLRVAKAVGVEQFVVATELHGVQFSSQWPWFLTQAHDACGCTVSYAAQDTQFIEDAAKLPRVRFLGTDYYPALKLPADASQWRVTRGWESKLSVISRSRLARTSLDEVSIRATAGAYYHPWAWDISGPHDPTVQVRYFRAACAAAAHYHMTALFFFFVPLNDNIQHPFTFPAFFVDNAGSKAIRSCRNILG